MNMYTLYDKPEYLLYTSSYFESYLTSDVKVRANFVGEKKGYSNKPEKL